MAAARADHAPGTGGGTLDWWFARLTGLRHILVSGADRARGRNACRAAVSVGMSCMVAVFAFLPAGLRRAANDFTALSFYAGNQANHVLACYKIAVVLHRSDDIRRCMDVTGAGFLSSSRRDGRTSRRAWIGRFARVLYTFVAPSVAGLLFWVSTPWLLDDATVTVRHADRTHSSYRLNVFNLYYGVPDAAYDRHFGLFYAVETVLIVAYAYFTFVFDMVMVIIGFAICGQLESVNRAIASLGYADAAAAAAAAAAAGPRRRTPDVNGIMKLVDNHKVFDELKMILIDHQKVLQKMHDFYAIVRPVILIQIFIASGSHIVVWIITALNCSESEFSKSILSIKMLTASPAFVFELFVSCSLFGSINEQKDSINFALYSSNWTKMNEKNRKLVLLAMKMNNANRLKIKITSTKIVNLEMFTQTMRFCYSIFSMLVNYNKNQMR